MNNWNTVIQDIDDDLDVLVQQFGIVDQDSNLPPMKPQRPPEELIHKTSPDLLQFLSISENVRPDPTIVTYGTHTVDPVRNVTMGPRDVPNNINELYKMINYNVPRTPPYLMEEEPLPYLDERTFELPVIPLPPIEMQQYNSHQRVLSSILNSNGVSIEEEVDYLEFDSPERDNLSMVPLTPSKLKRTLDLPSLEPMTPTKRSMDLDLDKRLPSLPAEPEYDGEYFEKEESPPIALPSLPFASNLLKASHFKQAGSMTLLSNIWDWCLKLEKWFPNQSISIFELKKCIHLLFKYQIPELSEVVLEAVSHDVIESLTRNGNLTHHEGIAEFFDVPVSGVYPSLKDCYSPMNHIFPTPYRCYSHCCTYERLNYSITPTLQTSNMILGADWVSHWKLDKDKLQDINKRMQIQQSHIFDLIKSVRNFINAGKVLLEVFGEGFLKNKQFFTGEDNVNWDKFYDDAFITVKNLINVTREYLFEPLIQKLNEDGIFISGISEITQNWLKEVQVPLLLYAEKRVLAHNLIKSKSASKNSKFSEWITRTNASVSRDCNSERLFSVTFLIFFTTFKVTLLAIQDNTDEYDPEHRALAKILKDLDLLVHKSNKVQATLERKIEINTLKAKLVLKYNKQPGTDLDLDNDDRQILKIGQVVRKRDILHRVLNDTPLTLILLDNFLLVAEEVDNGHYKVTETPLNLSYLFVENRNYEEASTPLVPKSPRRGGLPEELTESHVFRVRHYIKNLSYTFETDLLEQKTEWLNELMKLKSLVNQKSFKFEPFKLSVIGDSLLGIDLSDVQNFRQLLPDNDIIETSLQKFDSELPRIASISKILCFSIFKYKNKKYILLGTTNGLFLSLIGRPRGWRKVLDLKSVTQVKVVEEFGLIFILSDKTFTYYFLDAFMSNSRIVGEKLSKQDVSFFKIGKQNNVTMIFFMKMKQSSSYFKVLVPVVEKSTNKVESFQEYKKFYIPGECSDLTIFNSTIAIHTKKNFEVMSLSVLYPQQIPDLSANGLGSSELENLKKTLNQPGLKPMGIYKLINDKEFLIVYSKLAIFVNKSGVLSKDRLVKFSIKVRQCFFDKNLLILSNEEFIEIWYINNTKKLSYQLVQVIAAQDLRMLHDDEGKGIFSMVHPKYPERQLLLALQPKY